MARTMLLAALLLGLAATGHALGIADILTKREFKPLVEKVTAVSACMVDPHLTELDLSQCPGIEGLATGGDVPCSKACAEELLGLMPRCQEKLRAAFADQTAFFAACEASVTSPPPAPIAPAIAPVPAPEPAPVPAPEPASVPPPAPEPAPMPAPVPAPEPAPEPAPAPVAAPPPPPPSAASTKALSTLAMAVAALLALAL